jgi:hypothetical protein
LDAKTAPQGVVIASDFALVAASAAESAKAVMEEAFERVMGDSGGKLKVDFGQELQGIHALRLL